MPSIYTGVEEKVIDSALIEKEIEELKKKLVRQMKISSQISNSIFEELK